MNDVGKLEVKIRLELRYADSRCFHFHVASLNYYPTLVGINLPFPLLFNCHLLLPILYQCSSSSSSCSSCSSSSKESQSLENKDHI